MPVLEGRVACDSHCQPRKPAKEAIQRTVLIRLAKDGSACKGDYLI